MLLVNHRWIQGGKRCMVASWSINRLLSGTYLRHDHSASSAKPTYSAIRCEWSCVMLTCIDGVNRIIRDWPVGKREGVHRLLVFSA